MGDPGHVTQLAGATVDEARLADVRAPGTDARLRVFGSVARDRYPGQ